MAFEQKNNNGALFKNDKKTADNQPDYRGSAMIDNQEYEMAAWLKTGRNGKFMSFSFKLKDEGNSKSSSSKRSSQQEEESGEDMPF